MQCRPEKWHQIILNKLEPCRNKTKKNMRICYETDNGPTDFWTSCFLYLFHHLEDTSYLLPICYLYSHCIALVKFVFNLSGQVHESLTHFSLLLTTSFPTAHNRKYRPIRTVASDAERQSWEMKRQQFWMLYLFHPMCELLDVPRKEPFT